MLAPLAELRTFTGLTQPAAVARRLREMLGNNTITVNAAGCVTLANDAWQRIKTLDYSKPTLANNAPRGQTWTIRNPKATHHAPPQNS